MTYFFHIAKLVVEAKLCSVSIGGILVSAAYALVTDPRMLILALYADQFLTKNGQINQQ